MTASLSGSFKIQTPAKRWIAPGSPQGGARSRLFCFPFAGGSERIFDAWNSVLGPEIEVRAIRLPGRGARISEPPCRSMAELVPPIAEAIAALDDRPFALFGHSMGALVAFEVARALRRLGVRGPTHLVASGARPPHCRDERNYHLVPDHELIGLLRELGGTPEAVFAQKELMELLLPIIRADMAVCETYRPADESLLATRLVVFGGNEDAEVPVAELSRWGEWTKAGCELHLFDGGHHFLEPFRSAVLDAIRIALFSDRADAG